ncbi:MAG: hypothetical protein JO053_01655 [Acidobacteria bacterium]|nr:hypothetical protein [Acidobacteriota bacterium]
MSESTHLVDQTPEPDKVTVIVDDAPVVPANRPRKVYAGMWGPLEIGAVTIGALVLVAAAMVYFFFVVPSNRQLAMSKSDSDRLDSELVSANTKWGDINNSQTQVDKLVASVDDFESRVLPAVTNGQGALYQRINGLIASYGLVNTSGPDYAPLDAPDQNQGNQSDQEKGRAKFRSIYPGVYVSMTVEGSYQNLRRFLREIETGNEFIVISTVELAPSDNETQQKPQQVPVQPVQPNAKQPMMPNGQPLPNGFNAGPVRMTPGQQLGAQAPQRQLGKMHGEVVSLHIELAAYFRRPNFVPQGVQQ